MMMRKLGIALFLVLLIALVLLAILPINRIIENQLKQIMADMGLPPVQFTIESLSFERAVFRDISHSELNLSADKLTVSFVHEQGDYKGKWHLEGITPPPNSLAIPELQGGGDFSYSRGVFSLDGTIRSKDEQYRADLDLKDKQLVIRNLTVPWEGGRLHSKLARIDLAKQSPIVFTLEVERVPLARLLELMAPGKALATGLVSGRLQLTIEGKKITVASGRLQTLDKGVVQLAPDVIPATNEQMQLLRDALSNFHYQEFALNLDSGKDEQLSILLQLHGNNPELYNGREVKMNVNFSGDVLQLIQHSVMPVISPEQFLKQDQP